MIPSLVVDEVRDSLVEYLASTFALADDDVRAALSEFLQHEADGIFRGPYLRVRTPFEGTDDRWRSPLDWLPENFRPYLHQATAFDRLGSRDSAPQPTIVTTGTGSGKTECFLLPILDHCARARARGEDGIKALILYPMNALASDQANRIAQVIAENGELGGVTAGLYIGEDGNNAEMSADHIIDQRYALRANPPDILLTNYKMLDFLLLRTEDRDLWAVNGPETLRYIVLDEFHTYDGAQGTDVAMLIRRVGRTLGMANHQSPLGVATPVATSATLASEPGAVRELREFAGKVFGVEFGEDAIVGESRQSIDDVFADLNYYLQIPQVSDVLAAEDANQVAATFCAENRVNEAENVPPPRVDEEIRLGEVLLQHPLTRAVLSAVGTRPRTWRDAVREIVRNAPEWGRTYMESPADVEQALSRFLWLISIARRKVGARTMPLFNVEVQIWVREVSRLLRTVDTQPGFRWVDSARQDEPDEGAPLRLELPAVYCRKCGMSGWMAVQSELNAAFINSPATIYQAATTRSPTVRTLILSNESDPNTQWFDPLARWFVDKDHERAVPVIATSNDDDARRQTCPACGEFDAIRFVGLRVASLSSVSINTLFASNNVEHEERKILAFTDSVQDASHRAAFFAGRTHRVNLRSLMSRTIHERETLTLNDLGDELFLRAETPHQRYEVAPPDLLRDPDVRTVWTDDIRERGLDVLQLRLGFEADLEFGLRTRVGRTLELSDVAAAYVPLDEEVIDLIAEDVAHTLGEVPSPVSENLEAWSRGMVERLRLKGAINNRLLSPYAASGGEQWHVWGGRPAGLPPFPPGIGRPTFATSGAKGDFDSLGALSTNQTWFVDWTVRNLGLEPAVARDLNQRFFPLLANTGDTVVSIDSPNGRVFGLHRDAVHIWDLPDDPDRARLQCGVCGGRHVAPAQHVDEWVGSACLRYRCPGSYQMRPSRDVSYYRKLYRSGVTRRVVTGEHTGLLDRKSREALEERFKHGTDPADENLLAATPTLEMGIDIGDLSTVLLTSVPPNPAAYLQRVGRAGRATGNSLVATFVPTDRHGLYYLSEPESMLTGDVRPPNCYLDALDTLKRQYVAFLLDRVADLSVDAPRISNDIGGLASRGLEDGGLLRIVIDISMTDPSQVESFLSLFGTQLAADTVAELHEFAAAGIEGRIKQAIDRWQADLDELGKRRSRLNRAIEKTTSELGEDSDEVRALLGQRRVITTAMQDKRREYSFSALGRLGLLPNYTLIEDGAMLTATLWSRSDDGEFEVDKYEYNRAGSLAVREFAPGNTFYAGGHRHTVDALEIGPVDEPLYEVWRLCPECGFATPEPEEGVLTECPRCSGIGIIDVGSRYSMLRLAHSYASSSEEDARVFDESDNRHQEQYEVITTVDVDPPSIRGAWSLEDAAFGAELAHNTTLRTINLGFTQRRGQTLPVAGKQRHVTHFQVCAHCGAAERDDAGGKRPERVHQGWCKVRSGSVKKKFEKLVLYHELVTDAVRLLLPVSLFEVEQRLASFKALLLLGLREDFGGDPDHLRVALSDMPNRAGQGRRNFLVLYDRVPGGTGYLERLADPDRVRQILEKGRDVIAHCVCQSEGRRACHRCLLGVTERREYDLVARETALSLVNQLLENWTPQNIDTIGSIDLGLTEESELERRFKVALQDWCARDDQPHLTLRPMPGKGRYDAFELRVERGDEVLRWRIDEQEGISTTPNTIPDFFITRLDERSKPIALYLDGFQYHASVENPNMKKDGLQRSGARTKYIVWNMTWDDVAAFHKAARSDGSARVPQVPLLAGSALTQAKAAHVARGGNVDYTIVNQNPVALLLSYLENPDESDWRSLALSTVAGAMAGSTSRGMVAEGGAGDWLTAVARADDLTWSTDAEFAAGAVAETARGMQLGVLLRLDDPKAEKWTVVASLPDASSDIETIDLHRPRWQDWLQWSNVLQFITGPGRDFLLTTTTSDHLEIADFYAVSTLEAPGTPEEEPKSVPISALMEEELSLVEDEGVAELVRSTLLVGAQDFVAGAEVDGVPLEAGWPDAKLAIVPVGWATDPPNGWTVIEHSTATASDILEQLKKASS